MNWFQNKIDEITIESKNAKEKASVNTDLQSNVRYFKERLGNSFDVKYRNCTVSGNSFVFIMLDGMCDSLLITEQIMKPIINENFSQVKEDKIVYDAADRVSASIDKSITNDLNKAIEELISGNLVMMAELSRKLWNVCR